MMSLGQRAEGLRGSADIPARDRGRPQHAALEQRQQLTEHLLDAFGANGEEVEGTVDDAWMGGGHRRGVADVDFSHFDEVSALRQQTQRGIDEFPREAVENDVHAAPLGGAQEVLLEVKVA